MIIQQQTGKSLKTPVGHHAKKKEEVPSELYHRNGNIDISQIDKT
jgi:hypothetical protein